jgi:hypothetical protein
MSTHNPNNWQAGDKALCIRTSLWRDAFGEIVSDNAPIKGETYNVEGVMERRAAIGLSLTGFPACWWDAEEFVKNMGISELEHASEVAQNKA